MDRKFIAGIAFIVGALLLGPAAYFFARLDAEGELTSLRRERESLLSRAQTAENESASLSRQLGDVKTAGSRTDRSAREIASEVDRLAREKGEASDRAQQAEADLLKARNEAEDLRRRNQAEIDRLKGVLEKNGIYEHLSAEEIQARMVDGEARFRRAFEGKDKQGVMKAMAELQKLGPSAYDKCIEQIGRASCRERV